MAKYSEDAVTKSLEVLSEEGQLAFGLSCSERLYPNYVAFTREQGWGHPETLRRALDLGWSALDGNAVPAEQIGMLRERVQLAEPETEDFDTILVSPALDAAAAAGLVLRFIENRECSVLIEAASLCRDTVYMYIQALEQLDPTDSDFEERIAKHHLMQREICRQLDDLRRLDGFMGSAIEVAELKKVWRSPQRSNIDQDGSLGVADG